MHTCGLTGSGSLNSSWGLLHQESTCCSQCRAGGETGGSRNKWFWQLVGNVPQTSPDLRAMSNGSLKLSWRVFMVAASLGETPRRQVLARAWVSPLYKNLLVKVGPGVPELKKKKPIRGKVSGKESCLFQMYVSKRRADFAHRPTHSSSHWQAVSKSF